MNPALLAASRRLHRIFRSRGLSFSCAESCTGGLVSACITAVPGASAFFTAGLVVYAASAKQSVLRVSASTLRRHGLVSAETAGEMARKARLLTAADYALSTTGNLGPDVLEGKERGLVFIAVSSRSGTVVKEHRFRGSREAVRQKAVSAGLRMVAREVLKNA
ncbi:MAG: CinA family protein [Thermodesulfovibrionales bacterium]